MENFAFVDGSYNESTKVYGYGGFLNVAGERSGGFIVKTE